MPSVAAGTQLWPEIALAPWPRREAARRPARRTGARAGTPTGRPTTRSSGPARSPSRAAPPRACRRPRSAAREPAPRAGDVRQRKAHAVGPAISVLARRAPAGTSAGGPRRRTVRGGGAEFLVPLDLHVALVDHDDQEIFEASAIEANRFSTSTFRNLPLARSRFSTIAGVSASNGVADLHVREAEHFLFRDRHVAVDVHLGNDVRQRCA